PSPDGDPAAPREPEDGRGRRHPHRDAAAGPRRGLARAGPFAPLAQSPARPHGRPLESGLAAGPHDAAPRTVHARGAPGPLEEHRTVNRPPRDGTGAIGAPSAAASRRAEDDSLKRGSALFVHLPLKCPADGNRVGAALAERRLLVTHLVAARPKEQP